MVEPRRPKNGASEEVIRDRKPVEEGPQRLAALGDVLECFDGDLQLQPGPASIVGQEREGNDERRACLRNVRPRNALGVNG